MKRTAIKLVVLIVLVLCMPSTALADGTISDGDAQLYCDDSGCSGFSADGGATSQLYWTWWWYRVSGDTQETEFPMADSEVYAGNTYTYIWSDVSGRGLFSAQLVVTVTDTGANTAVVEQALTLANLGAGDLAIDVFSYADIEIDGSSWDDTAIDLSGGGNNYMSATDSGGVVVEYRVNFVSNSAYEVQTWSDIYDDLSDAAVTNFTNSGLPYSTPGDLEAGFQHSRTIPGGGSAKYQAFLAIDDTAPAAVTLDDLAARSPGALVVGGAMAVGVVGAGWLARRRRRHSTV